MFYFWCSTVYGTLYHCTYGTAVYLLYHGKNKYFLDVMMVDGFN